MHVRERSRAPVPGAGIPARRATTPGQPLLALQQTAGNAAVSDLITSMTVQRFWPFDDDEDQEDDEEGTPDEGPWAGPEEVPKNPEAIPNAPAGEPEAELPDPRAPVQWLGWVAEGSLSVVPMPLAPGSMVESSRGVVADYARSLAYEALPPELTAGAGVPVMTDATNMLMPAPNSLTRQILRAWAGIVSPDIARIVNGPGGGPGGPGGEPAAGGEGAGPAGIPGMEPVTPGGEGAGPAGIPGMEPVTPGGGGAGPGPAGARPMLRLGSVGDGVRDAQELLVRRGATLSPDGEFGGLTQRAVIDFQRSAGLDPDGIVGPRTWAALEGA